MSDRDPLFTSVAVYAAWVARSEGDPRMALGTRLEDAHAHWRQKLRSPGAGELRAQYLEAYKRARSGAAPPEDDASLIPANARTPVRRFDGAAGEPVSAAPTPQPPTTPLSSGVAAAVARAHEHSGFARCLARGDAIVAEALAFRDRARKSSGGKVVP
jgi:hypothetical protein